MLRTKLNFTHACKNNHERNIETNVWDEQASAKIFGSFDPFVPEYAGPEEFFDDRKRSTFTLKKINVFA